MLTYVWLILMLQTEHQSLCEKAIACKSTNNINILIMVGINQLIVTPAKFCNAHPTFCRFCCGKRNTNLMYIFLVLPNDKN